MLTNTERQQIVEEVNAGTYGIDEALDDIAAAQKGEEVRKALYAEALVLNREGHAGSTDMIARQQIANLQTSVNGQISTLRTEVGDDIDDLETALNSGIATQNGKIAAQDATIANVVANYNVEYGSTELWATTGETGALAAGTTVTLSEDVSHFDYIDIYSFCGNSNVLDTVPVDAKLQSNAGYALRWVNLSDPGSGSYKAYVRIIETRLHIIGTTLTIDHQVTYRNGEEVNISGAEITQSNRSTYMGELGIMKVVGRKITANTEIEDVRIGADGTEYASAGQAVRAQVQALNDAIPAVDASLATAGKAADAKATGDALTAVNGRLDEHTAEIHSGELSGVFVVGTLNFKVTPWINGTSNKQISTKADYTFHLYKGDTISLADFTDKEIYVVMKEKDGGTISYASGWKSTTVVIPFDGEYGMIVRTSGTFATVDDVDIIVTTQGAYAQILKIPHVSDNAEVAYDVSEANNRRLAQTDGKLVISRAVFETVNLVIPQMLWGVSASRISTKYGQRIPLKSGDTVNLSTGVFFYGYYDSEGVVHSGRSWVSRLDVVTDGDYVFCMRYSTEADISDFDAFVDGFSITVKTDGEKTVLARSIDLFRTDRFYDHMLLNKINGSNVIVPLQSIPHIMMSKRLGFKVIEVNVKGTSDGHYIVTHGGTNGAFGAMFAHVDGETDISATLINSVTLEWIKTNVRFVSTYPKYRTAPATLEEFLTVCKQLKMIPLVQVADVSAVAEIADSIIGKDNYIAYNGNRNINGGMIMRWSNLTTKADILAQCNEYGNPFMYGMANPSSFSDADLQDIIDTLHSNGYIIGFQDTYLSEPVASKYMNMGMDFCATTWNINDIECGNYFNSSADIDFSDFETNGEVNSDNNLVLDTGEYVRKWGGERKFLVGMVVYARFSGTLKVNMSSNFRSGTYTSDGSECVRISCGALNGDPSFMLTAQESTTVYELTAKASIM